MIRLLAALIAPPAAAPPAAVIIATPLGETGVPVLVGVSRKSLVGMIAGRPPDGRLAGSLAFAALAVAGGAAIVRAHDVAETVDAVKVASALRRAGAAEE